MKNTLVKNVFAACLLPAALLLVACGQPAAPETQNETVPQFSNTTIEVELSNKNCLAILLAGDGTINRKGSSALDTADHNFFMGITREPLFDSLMKSVTPELLSYCGKKQADCDTTKATCRVKISLSGQQGNTGLEYCVNGTMNELPKPIRDYVTAAIRVTEPWYSQQVVLTQ